MAYITECGDPVFILYLLIDTYLLPTYNRVSLTASSYSKNSSFSVPKRSDISSHEDQWEEMSDDEAIEDDLSYFIDKESEVELSNETGQEPGSYCTVDGKMYHIQTAVQKFCNGGRTCLPAQARKRRFYGKAVKSTISLNDRSSCPSNCDEPCKILTTGEIGIFISKAGNVNIEGKVVYLSKNSYSTAGAKSSVSCIPANSVCVDHDFGITLFVMPSENTTRLIRCNPL